MIIEPSARSSVCEGIHHRRESTLNGSVTAFRTIMPASAVRHQHTQRAGSGDVQDASAGGGLGKVCL